MIAGSKPLQAMIVARANPRSAAAPTSTLGGMAEAGPQPDYRFTLANERTFLAWIRTALALIAGGVALMQLVPSFGIPGVKHGLSVVLIALGGALATLAVRRWNEVQDAMSRDEDLPLSRLPAWLGISLLLVTIALLILVVFEPNTH